MRTILASAAALALLSVPFVFWYQTWFGRTLTDSEITRALSANAPPRDTQHALSLLAAAMERGDKHPQFWYVEVAELSWHPNIQVRRMAAWVMGQDNQSELFHETLRTALSDSDTLVRSNAALALVRFGDACGRAELVRILESSPDMQQVWEALRGLYIAGEPEDLAAIAPYGRAAGPAIRAQAELTAQAIRTRTR
jgi:hypothetical protein